MMTFEEAREWQKNWKAPKCTNPKHKGICFPNEKGEDINGRKWK